MTTIDAPLDRIRQPEYTGENRCLPCTFVNSFIALAFAIVIGYFWLPLGVVTVIISAGAIYFRGYLIPGTPTLTKRYMPARVLRLFGKDPLDQPADGYDESVARGETNRDGEKLLREADVIEDCAEEDDVCLTDRFSEVWWRRIRQIRDDEKLATDRLAAAVEVDPEEIAFERSENAFQVVFEGDPIARWDSDAAFYADLAVEPTLDEWIDEWQALEDRERTQVIGGMRAFLKRCPRCDANLEQVENVRQTCCAGDIVDVSVDCNDCGATVFSGAYQ